MTAPAWLATWPIGYPHPRRPWTLRSGSGPEWAALVPETGEIEPVEPGCDRRLPGLASALRAGRLIGYRVERRAVVQTAGRYVKVVRPSRLAQVVDAHHRLADTHVALRGPAVLQACDDGRIELAALPGPSVHDLFRSPGKAVAIPIERVADALVALHRLEPTDDQAQAEPPDTWVRMVARAEPEVQARLAKLAERLPALPVAAPAVVHGDLHDKNVLLAGRSVGLIDLDGVRTGAAEDDLANLGVHLQLRCLQSGRPIEVGRSLSARLYRRYGAARAVSPARIDAVERHTWFRLACLYHVRKASRPLVPDLLRLAIDHR